MPNSILIPNADHFSLVEGEEDVDQDISVENSEMHDDAVTSAGHTIDGRSKTLTNGSQEDTTKHYWPNSNNSNSKPYPAISIDSRDSMRAVTPQSTVGSEHSNCSNGAVDDHIVEEPIRTHLAISDEQNTLTSNRHESVILMEHMRDAMGTLSYSNVWDDSFTGSRYHYVIPGGSTIAVRETLHGHRLNSVLDEEPSNLNVNTQKSKGNSSRRLWQLKLFKSSHKQHDRSLALPTRPNLTGTAFHSNQINEIASASDVSDALNENQNSPAPISRNKHKNSKTSAAKRSWWQWNSKAKYHDTPTIITPPPENTSPSLMAGPVLASAIPMRENTTLKKPQALECIQCPAVEIGTETTSPDIDITGLSSHAVADDTHSTPRPLLPDEQTLNSGGGSSSGNSKRYSPLFIVPPPLTERPSLPRRLYYYSEPYRRGVPLPTDSAHPTPLSMGEADYNENQTTSAANKQAAPNDLSPFLWQTQDEVRMARQRSRIRNGQATAVSSNQHPHICIDGEGHHYTRGTTLCGICCSILFFPCSLLCCVTSSERRCKKCQQHVSQRHYR